MITSTASHGFPPSNDARAASTATYGGVAPAEPIPAGWNPARYSCQSPDAPPQAGRSAPPLTGLGPSSERPATRAISKSPANSSTPGLVRMRCAKPVSTSSVSSSFGSSIAWWLPAVSSWLDLDSAFETNSTSRIRDRPRGRSECS